MNDDHGKRLRAARLELAIEEARRRSCLKRAANTDRPTFRGKMLREAGLAATLVEKYKQRIADIESEQT